MNNAVRVVVDRFNACAVALQDSPRFGGLVRRRMTVVTVRLDGAERTGHATARRLNDRRAEVNVRF
jgi:hypothetical protein